MCLLANNSASMAKITNWSSDTRNSESAKILLSFIQKSKNQTNEAREHSALILSWMELRQNITKSNTNSKNNQNNNTNSSSGNVNETNQTKSTGDEDASSISDSDHSRIRRGSSNVFSPRDSLVGTDEFSTVIDSKGNISFIFIYLFCI